MADVRKVLGQVIPDGAPATLYQCPVNKQAVVSTFLACNMSATPKTFRMAVSPNAEVLEAKHYQFFDETILGNSTFAATIGICLSEDDIVRVEAETDDVAFTLYGQEI